MSFSKHIHSASAVLAASAVLLVGCGKPPETQVNALPPESTAPDALQADAERAAQLATREQELAQREAEIDLQKRELNVAKREGALAAQKPKSTTPVKPVVGKPVPPKTADAIASASKPAAKPVAVTVPSGTSLTVSLTSALSTRTAKQGDPFEARTVSDIMVDGKRAVPANSRVTGSVTGVVSGSSKIGGVPTLGLRFDSLVLDDGQRIAINGELDERGKSDTGRDSAKIIGGAAAGAILGHQVKSNDGGKIIGGLLGGAIGAVAARKTGTEVELAAGSTMSIALSSSFEVLPH
ncbi:MAG: glycine zipper 2TM domain-containing protein [Steroidobacteraceae bacterium]